MSSPIRDDDLESSSNVTAAHSDDENDSTFRPPLNLDVPMTSRVLRGDAKGQSRSPADDPLATSSPKENSLNLNTSSVVIIEDTENFKSFESESEEESDSNDPFRYFRSSLFDEEEDEEHPTMPGASISLSYISNITKLGEIKDGKPYDNWTLWSQRVRSFLTLQDLWVDVDKSLAEQTQEEAAKCAKAYHIISMALADAVLTLISGLNNSVSAWHILRNYYNKPTVINKVAAIRKIVNEKLHAVDDMENHILRMRSHFQCLSNLGVKWDEPTQVAFLLQSLPQEFDPLVSSIGAFEEKDISMERIISAILDEYKRRKSTALTKAMQDLSFNPGVACAVCRNPGHGSSTCALNTRPALFCTNCNRYGHQLHHCHFKVEDASSTSTKESKNPQGKKKNNANRNKNRGNQAQDFAPLPAIETRHNDETVEASSAATSYSYKAYSMMSKKKQHRRKRTAKKSVFDRLQPKRESTTIHQNFRFIATC